MPALDICIDVSRWQGFVDWPAIAGAGIRIAMIKATETTSWVDTMFERNRAQALASGIFVIPYHFLRPGAWSVQAEHFASVAGLGRGVPFALDWEGRAGETATATEVEAIGEILATITGRPPLGYWGIPGSTPGQPTAQMLEWPRWVPRYPKAGTQNWQDMSVDAMEEPQRYWLTGGRGLPLFAQYTSQGRVPGVNGDVDRSVAFFADETAALAWCRGEAMPALPAVPSMDVIEQILSYADFRLGVGAYQEPRGLTVDGRIGPITLAKIGEDMRKR